MNTPKCIFWCIHNVKNICPLSLVSKKEDKKETTDLNFIRSSFVLFSLSQANSGKEYFPLKQCLSWCCFTNNDGSLRKGRSLTEWTINVSETTTKQVLSEGYKTYPLPSPPPRRGNIFIPRVHLLRSNATID